MESHPDTPGEELRWRKAVEGQRTVTCAHVTRNKRTLTYTAKKKLRLYPPMQRVSASEPTRLYFPSGVRHAKTILGTFELELIVYM